MPDDATRTSDEVAFQSSRDLSELKVQVTDNKHAAIKVRIKSCCCDIVLLAQRIQKRDVQPYIPHFRDLKILKNKHRETNGLKTGVREDWPAQLKGSRH